MTRAITLATICVALTVGNFAWQAVTGQAWGVAAERSFFQGVALFVAWLWR